MNERILEGILPNLDMIDGFLNELLPENQNMRSINFIEDVLKGNWVLDPGIFWEYIKQIFAGYFYNWKSLFISILVLFILSAVVSGFLTAFKNEGAAKCAKMFFALCQLVVLINAFHEVLVIVSDTMARMLEFLKVMIPAYMICVAAAGSGLTALIFYKLLVGFVCLMEGLLVASLTPLVEGYMMLGVLESILGEEI